jgi:CHASE2 domain-containing sensor protein
MKPEIKATRERKPKNLLKMMLRIFLGSICLLLALAGAFFPIIPGFVFFFVGLILLSFDFPFMNKPSEYIKKRFPKARESIEKAEKNVRDRSGLSD